MHSRTFSTTVCLFWLVSMTWLVSQKVLPALRIGQPPNYRTILEAQKQIPVVGWRLAFNHRELGWALTETKQQENGITEIGSRVHFDELPLAELTSLMSRVFNRMLENHAARLSLDTRSSLLIDPLGKLARFDSTIHTNAIPDSVRIQGVVEGSQLRITIRFKEFSKELKDIYLPQNALLGDALSPQSQLPNLCEGQTWTVPSFSPFRSANAPLEIQIAKVEGRELITWNDEIIDAWIVVYQHDPGRGFVNNQTPRDKLWVADDGRVLKQEATIFDSSMTFTRMTDREARKLAREVQSEEGEE
ncbi:MAG: hypothetical protein IT426_17575 [Pirellulales bacterium]|nr:hypothetical protein [Pirellulales bacterium]